MVLSAGGNFVTLSLNDSKLLLNRDLANPHMYFSTYTKATALVQSNFSGLYLKTKERTPFWGTTTNSSAKGPLPYLC
jgi:hypothetical protein